MSRSIRAALGAGGPVAGGASVTITGTDLARAVEVAFGAAPASFTVNADGSITALAPAGTAGTVDVTVTSHGGTSATSAADQFTYVHLQPVVTGVSPATGPAGGGTSVTISGTDLANAVVVDFGGVPAAGFTVNADGTLTAIAPAAAVGAVDVTVTTDGGTSAASAADVFTYV